MNEYFPQEEGIDESIGCEAANVLSVIANRFMTENPPVSVVYYLRSKNNFRISADYMEEIALHEKFSGLLPEQYVYSWASLKVPQSGPFHFRFSAWGPVSIWVNGKFSFRTNHMQERFSDQIWDICLNLKEGENSLFFQCMSTPLGCGFRIGSSSYKGKRIQFFGPDREHRGMSGFVYSRPFSKQIERIPELYAREEETEIHWLPDVCWPHKDAFMLMKRLYGAEEQETRTKRWKIVKASRIDLLVSETVVFSGTSEAGHSEDLNGKLWIDGTLKGKMSGYWKVEMELKGGSHLIAWEGTADALRIFTKKDGGIVEQKCPVNLAEGRKLDGLFAGPFAETQEMNMKELLSFQTPFQTEQGISFWRADLPEMYIRPFNEGVLYGEWSYPLGVTLYGMIQSGRLLNDTEIQNYVEGHMKKSTGFYEYCLWDQAFYGAAPFHNQLTTIDSLDDCGSFASALLEVMKDHEIPEGKKITDMVAEYMIKTQHRLEDGTFYRNNSYLPIMNETIWADDMYMSIPFLCRYYEETGDDLYLEEAKKQTKQFFHYLYMPELQIMSHIYDTHYKIQTKVPWGRGNGWVLVSLTELLAVIPDGDNEKEELVTMFRTLCQGYLRLQGEEGMWHQVLTVDDSYEETSCTAMFIYGFARGVRYGWLEEKNVYAESAIDGWKALCKKAIDRKGNIYGVCSGSGYSFSKEYYAKDLSWIKNDLHGTGIVMLAGIEVEKMKQLLLNEAI